MFDGKHKHLWGYIKKVLQRLVFIYFKKRSNVLFEETILPRFVSISSFNVSPIASAKAKVPLNRKEYLLR